MWAFINSKYVILLRFIPVKSSYYAKKPAKFKALFFFVFEQEILFPWPA